MFKSCSTLVVCCTKHHSNGSPVTAYHVEVNGRTITVKGGFTEATLTDLAPHASHHFTAASSPSQFTVKGSQSEQSKAHVAEETRQRLHIHTGNETSQ